MTRASGNALTVAEFEADWMTLCPRGELSTINHNRHMVRPLLALHGHKPLTRVTVFDARRFAREHPSSVRYAKTFFADAVRKGRLDTSPFADVQSPSSDGRAGMLVPTEQQVRRCAAAAPPALADAIMFSAYSGPRLEQLARVEVKDVLEGGTRVRVRGLKQHPDYSIAVLGLAQGALARRLEQTDVGLVFTTSFGRRWRRDSVCRAWASVRAEGGLTEPQQSWHSLRHFCATRLLNLGYSAQDVAVQLGHTDRYGRPNADQIHRTYGHPDNELALRRLEGGQA